MIFRLGAKHLKHAKSDNSKKAPIKAASKAASKQESQGASSAKRVPAHASKPVAEQISQPLPKPIPNTVRPSAPKPISKPIPQQTLHPNPQQVPQLASGQVPKKLPQSAVRPYLPADSLASAAAGASAPPNAGRSPRLSYQSQQHKNNKMTIAIIIIVAVLVVLICIYMLGVARFQSQYYPNTMANGHDLSGQSVEQAQALVDKEVAEYDLHITGYEFDMHVLGSEIDMTYESNSPAQDAIESQNAYAWPYMIFVDHDLSDSFDISFSQEKLQTLVQDKVDVHNETTAFRQSDEGLSFNKEKDQWEYVEAVLGNVIEAPALIEAATAAVSDRETSLEVTRDELVHPKSEENKDAIVKAAQKANEIQAKYCANFTLGGNTPFVIDGATVAPWITVSEDYREVSVDQAKVDAWLDSVENLLSGATERTYTRPDGKECTVSGGDYSWQAQNVDAAMETIKSAMGNGVDSEAIDIPCITTGNGFLGMPGADWGKRYADVDIEEQHARFYDENGELIWENDVITGTWGTEFATPTGVYTITEKRSPASLRSVGEYRYIDENGEEQVEEDHVFGRDVEYWMPFIRTFIGFHDAWWQTDFGGDLYRNPAYGSGGCINLPTDKAAELYDIIQPGDVVVVH